MSDLPRSLSLVSYAVNGSGLGHVARQVAIHRWLRRYASFAGVATQHWFLTTSEADTWLWHEGFAAFKLPSKSVVEAAGVNKLAYLALAKQWIWHSLALLRPDLLIVDTFPNGSFQELLGALDLCKRRALVLRPVKPDIAQQAAFRAVAGLYDRVIVPARASDKPGPTVGEALRDCVSSFAFGCLLAGQLSARRRSCASAAWARCGCRLSDRPVGELARKWLVAGVYPQPWGC